MLKKLSIVITLTLAWIGLAGSALASVPVSVNIVQLPEYKSVDNFQISYTASGGSAGLKNVVLQYAKEGQGWTTLGTFTESARTYQITPSQINEETKYHFRAIATGNDSSTDTSQTSTTVDRTPPPAPNSYSKEKTGSLSYRLRWRNADNDDVYKVYVYRSDEAGFTANNGTLIAQVNVDKNTETIWNNDIPQDREYFYLLRGVDRAGNASDPVGDVVIVSSSGSTSTGSTPEGEAVNGQEAVSGQILGTGTGGQVLGGVAQDEAEEDEMSDEAGQESEEDTDQAMLGADQINAEEQARKYWPIIGVGVLIFGLYWYLFRK
jgi:hypothetical protein